MKRGYFHICAEMAYQLKYRLYVFLSVDNFIQLSTHNQLPQSPKRLINKYDIKQLVLIFTEGGKPKIITETIS